MEEYKETIDFIKSKIGDFVPDTVIVLGSGLGDFCSGIDGISIKYSDIPNFLATGIKGHKGELLFAKINNKNVVVMQGRNHYYEGYTLKQITYPIKIYKMLGAKNIILTNAAGATSLDYNVGDIMMITDHINFMGMNPLIGKNDDLLGERFPDMTECYNKTLREIAHQAAKNAGIDLKEGVYLATSGPSYETPSEIKMFKMLGADAVGMSTVPETIVANYLKLNTLAFSIISNHAAGVSGDKLSHKEVLETGKIAGKKLNLLIKKILKN